MDNINEVISKAATLPSIGEVSTTEAEIVSRDAKHENDGCSQSRVLEFQRAANEGCVSVPFALTACIPESAIRKFTAKEPFVIHVNDNGIKSLVCYFGD